MFRTFIQISTKRLLSKSGVKSVNDFTGILVRRTLQISNSCSSNNISQIKQINEITRRIPGLVDLSSRTNSLHRNASSSTTNNTEDIQIYYGNLTSQIRAVKLFSLITSATGLAAQPMLIQKATEISSLGVGIAIGSFVGFFTFITPFLLHWITKKYVTYLHYNPETKKYTATTLSLFLRQKKTQFTKEEVNVPEVAGMFTSFSVKDGTALFVDPRLFSHPEHYGFIMGYDKPLDFKLEPLDQSDHQDKPNSKH